MRLPSRYIAIVATVLATTASVAGMADAIPGPSAQQCSALSKADFSGIPEAPTQILQAASVEATVSVPAYCVVKGVVAPNVGFELKLPAVNWNGRFFEAGCGNYCGG